MISAIYINGQFVIMGDDMPMARQKSPLFSYQGVPGMWTLPFKIPYAENAHLFGFANEPNVLIDTAELECKLLLYNSLLVPGTIVVDKCTSKDIYISVGAPYYDIDLNIIDKKIRDLDWDDIQLVSEPQVYVKIHLEDDGTADDTINIHTGFALYTVERVEFVPFYGLLSEIVEAINNDILDSGIHASIIGSDTIILEQVEMGSHNKVFKTSDIYAEAFLPSITFTLDFMEWLSAFHDDLIIYLNGLVDPDVYLSGLYYPDTNICFPSEFNKGHYGDLNEDFTGFINYYFVDTYKINYHSGEAFDGNQFALVPCVFLQTVLSKIFGDSALTILGMGVDDDRFKRVHFDNNHSTGKEWYDPISDITYIVWSDKVHIPNHLPDMTVREFFDAYRNKFNLYFDYDPIERKLYILSREGVITEPKKSDWSQRPYFGEAIKEFSRSRGIKFSSPIDSNDDFADTRFIYQGVGEEESDELQHADHQIGNGELEITSDFTHPSMNSVVMPDVEANLQKLPYKNQPGSGDEWEARRNHFAPSLLFFKGMDVVQNDKKYPYSTIDHLNANNEVDDSNMSLIWPKTFEIFWPNWAEFIQSTGQCRVVFSLNIADFTLHKWNIWTTFLQSTWLGAEFNVIELYDNEMLVEFVFHKRKTMPVF